MQQTLVICPDCKDVEIDRDEISLRLVNASGGVFSFRCPQCKVEVVSSASIAQMIVILGTFPRTVTDGIHLPSIWPAFGRPTSFPLPKGQFETN